MPALVTLEETKARLRIDHEAFDADLTRIIEQASDLVVAYVNRPADADPWTEDTAPPRAKLATLLTAQNIHDGGEEPLSAAVRALLHQDRRAVLAWPSAEDPTEEE